MRDTDTKYTKICYMANVGPDDAFAGGVSPRLSGREGRGGGCSPPNGWSIADKCGLDGRLGRGGIRFPETGFPLAVERARLGGRVDGRLGVPYGNQDGVRIGERNLTNNLTPVNDRVISKLPLAPFARLFERTGGDPNLGIGGGCAYPFQHQRVNRPPIPSCIPGKLRSA
jgi:hypothetical protein